MLMYFVIEQERYRNKNVFFADKNWRVIRRWINTFGKIPAVVDKKNEKQS